MSEILTAHPGNEYQTLNVQFFDHGEPIATSTEGHGAELQQYGLEKVETENAQSISDLHTLLVSLPPGDARDNAIGQFPGLGIKAEDFSVSKQMSLINSDPLEQQAVLPHLLDRAVHMVGGQERARTTLRYPGITLDADFGKSDR